MPNCTFWSLISHVPQFLFVLFWHYNSYCFWMRGIQGCEKSIWTTFLSFKKVVGLHSWKSRFQASTFGVQNVELGTHFEISQIRPTGFSLKPYIYAKCIFHFHVFEACVHLYIYTPNAQIGIMFLDFAENVTIVIRFRNSSLPFFAASKTSLTAPAASGLCVFQGSSEIAKKDSTQTTSEQRFKLFTTPALWF